MPVFELECTACGAYEERLLASYEQAIAQTCVCGSAMRKLISLPQPVVIELAEGAIEHAIECGPDAAAKERAGLAYRRDTSDFVNMRPFGRQKLAIESNRAILREASKPA